MLYNIQFYTCYYYDVQMFYCYIKIIVSIKSENPSIAEDLSTQFYKLNNVGLPFVKAIQIIP